MNDIIKIIKPLEDLGVLETWNKKTRRQICWSFGSTSSCSISGISSVVKRINGRGVRRTGKGYMNENFYFCSIL